MWLIFAGIAYETYRAEWRASRDFAANVVSLLEQDVARNVELYDLSLRAVVNHASDAEIMALPSDLRRMTLFDESANASGLGSILLLDKGGHVVADSRRRSPTGIYLGDREYFVAQRDGVAKVQPFISHPFVSRITQAYGIGFSRPVIDAKGAFNGIVVGTITLDFFSHLFDAVHLPPGSAIAMLHSDGTILMRAPVVTDGAAKISMGTLLPGAAKRAESGTFVKTSDIDGIERLYAFKRVGTLPIYMTVGLSAQTFLAPWRWQTKVIGFGFLLLTAMILFLGFMLTRELRRRTAAEHTLAELAATDPLTLLANRRRFDETLEVEWRRGIRDSQVLSLLMIDGDYFKAYNDTYGHVEGDASLRLLADTLKICVDRPGDLVARFGGEEFVVLLPSTDVAGALRIAQSIREAIVALALPHRGSPDGFMTVSIGVATRRPSVFETASKLVEAADSALYEAKADGRDCIVVDGARASTPFGWYETRRTKIA
jgi:diguanylate cyclase (GGDEF)-like protein